MERVLQRRIFFSLSLFYICVCVCMCVCLLVFIPRDFLNEKCAIKNQKLWISQVGIIIIICLMVEFFFYHFTAVVERRGKNANFMAELSYKDGVAGKK